jgi:hypothetical protein
VLWVQRCCLQLECLLLSDLGVSGQACPELKSKDLVSFLDEDYRAEDAKQRLFLAEAVKMEKSPWVQGIFDDGSQPKVLLVHFGDRQQIKPLIDRENELKRFFDGVLPRNKSVIDQ